MPRGDGTGPRGQGPGTGRGQGRGNINTGTRGFAGGAGPGGECVCPSCRTIKTHEPGMPCTEIKCPECGSRMVRK